MVICVRERLLHDGLLPTASGTRGSRMKTDVQQMLAGRGLNVEELTIVDVLLDAQGAGLADEQLEALLHSLNLEVAEIMAKLGCGRTSEFVTLLAGFASRADALDEG